MMARRKQIMALVAIVVLALFVVGFITGAVGTAMFASGDSEPQPLISKPKIEIPPEKVFVSAEPVVNEEEGHSAAALSPSDGFVLTNTILSSWIATVLLVALFFLATRHMAVVPTGIQNVMEAMLEGLLNFVQGVAGAENARRFFPLIATIFLFVLFNAWIGLLPFYPALGFLDDHGQMERHLLRPAGTDLNMPLALALVSFAFIEFWGLRLLKMSYLSKFVRLENLKRGKIFQAVIDGFVGLLELLSEFVRVVSFTFRLFGNMTAGEILVIMIPYLVPFVVILPFYGLEILVGFVQALIFAGLTLVFVVVAVTPHEHEAEEHS